MIGLGRTGEGMARRMIEKGIEVWGYSSTNYENACGQYEAGYISGCVTSLEYLVRAVKSDSKQYTSAGWIPGIFQITLPEQKTEDTLDELLPLLEEGDIIIDHSTSDIRKCQEMIDKAIDKHNKTATIISAILGGILLTFYSHGVLSLVGRV